MGHGDYLYALLLYVGYLVVSLFVRRVIADAYFPADSLATSTVCKTPIRVRGFTSELTIDILLLMPLDTYEPNPVRVMRRVASDEAQDLQVPAYVQLAQAAGKQLEDLDFVDRQQFYAMAKDAFAIIQTDDTTQYANVILFKGVI